MLTRSLALKVLLAALGIAAVLAMASIFVQNNLGWRLSGIAAIVGVSIALAIPATPSEGGGRIRLLGRVYLSVLGFGSAVAVLAAWTDGMTPLPELLAQWILLCVPSFLVAAPALHSRDGNERALAPAEWIAMVGAGLACLVGIGRILLDAPTGALAGDHGLWRGLSEGFMILGPSLTAAAAATGLRRASTSRTTPLPKAGRVDRVAGFVGVAASLATSAALLGGFALQDLFLATQDTPMPLAVPALEALAGTTATVAVASAAWCFIGLTPVPGVLRFLRHLSALALLMTGTLLSTVSWQGVLSGGSPGLSRLEFVRQTTFASAVLAGASLLAALVLMRVHRSRPHVGGRIGRVDWRCPRCGRREVVALGAFCCSECGLSAEVRVRDDRCASCGYDLRGIAADAIHCPECGHERQRPDAPALA